MQKSEAGISSPFRVKQFVVERTYTVSLWFFFATSGLHDRIAQKGH